MPLSTIFQLYCGSQFYQMVNNIEFYIPCPFCVFVSSTLEVLPLDALPLPLILNEFQSGFSSNDH
jgi:hypothetical protein